MDNDDDNDDDNVDNDNDDDNWHNDSAICMTDTRAFDAIRCIRTPRGWNGPTECRAKYNVLPPFFFRTVLPNIRRTLPYTHSRTEPCAKFPLGAVRCGDGENLKFGRVCVSRFMHV